MVRCQSKENPADCRHIACYGMIGYGLMLADGRPMLSEAEVNPVTCCRHTRYEAGPRKHVAAEILIVSRGGFGVTDP